MSCRLKPRCSKRCEVRRSATQILRRGSENWCSEHILSFTKRVHHTDLNQRYFARFCLTNQCVKSRLWISMIFTPSLTHVLSYIFWKFDQNLWVGIFLLINSWQFFQIFWKILPLNNYQNRHFLQFGHFDMIFDLFLCIPKIYFLISHNKILPS